MYLMSCTRPDIAYAVNKLSRYTSNPGGLHWQGIMRVLKYLRFTRDYGDCTTQDILLYLKDTVLLIGYLMIKTQNPIVIMSLHWEVQRYHGNPQNRRLLPDPQWNLSL